MIPGPSAAPKGQLPDPELTGTPSVDEGRGLQGRGFHFSVI